MLKKSLPFAFLALFVLLFNLFFWREKVALNLVLFGVLAGAAILFMHKGAISRTTVRITAAGTLLAGLFVLLYATDIARTAFILSFATFIGFVYSPQMRSVPFAFLGGIGNFFAGWFGLVTAMDQALQKREKRKKWRLGRAIAIGVVPVFLLTLFAGLFAGANPRFGKVFQVITVDALDWFLGIFDHLEPVRILFFGFSLLVCVGILFHYRFKRMENFDAHAKQTLHRRRKQRAFPFRMNALRQEHKIALLTVVSINVLALVNNVIDINWIWFNFELEPDFNLKQFVHEGTYLLIASILLSMGVMFYFFRGNLNFLHNNKTLRIASYVWIVQNFIMVISVFLRNYHYIDTHGLAYKRIGVIFFLALTIFGLVTLFLKIRQRKTFYHVVKVNAWATYAVLLLLAMVNWDGFITSYNFKHHAAEGVDIEFHLSMSDKVLPFLDENRALFEESMVSDNGWLFEEYEAAGTQLDYKIEWFKSKMENRSWLSWNLADARAMSYFDAQPEENTR